LNRRRQGSPRCERKERVPNPLLFSRFLFVDPGPGGSILFFRDSNPYRFPSRARKSGPPISAFTDPTAARVQVAERASSAQPIAQYEGVPHRPGRCGEDDAEHPAQFGAVCRDDDPDETDQPGHSDDAPTTREHAKGACARGRRTSTPRCWPSSVAHDRRLSPPDIHDRIAPAVVQRSGESGVRKNDGPSRNPMSQRGAPALWRR